jgi:hypothetical protein
MKLFAAVGLSPCAPAPKVQILAKRPMAAPPSTRREVEQVDDSYVAHDAKW